jgi:DNA-binding NarL/FixJ family response regulator
MGHRSTVKRARIAILDDHPLYRAGLKAMLDRDPDFTVVGTAGSLEDVFKICMNADILLLDWRLARWPKHLFEELQAWHPHLKVIAISASGEEDDVATALASGASGYLIKTFDGAELVAALCSVQCGNGYVSGTLGAKMLS